MAMWPDEGEKGARIDAAIDKAARQMTGGAPGGDFRARVLARLGERETMSGRWWLWLMVPMATAVIVFLVVVGRSGDSGNRGSKTPVTRPQPTETARRQSEPATRSPAAQSQTRQTPAPVRLRPDTTLATRGSGGTPGGRRGPRAAPSEVEALVTEALDVESIRLASIRLAPLPQSASIRIAPLNTIDPIDVAPLSTPDIDAPQRREP